MTVKQTDYHIPIRISGLADGEHTFDITARPDEIGLPAEYNEEVVVHAVMDKTHAQLILRVALSSGATFQCDRCLEPVRIPFAGEFSLFYARELSSARELDEEDVRIIDPNQPVIDISADVRDFALLAIPMRRIHEEDADGNPSCPVTIPEEHLDSGADKIDPRWEALQKLRNETT